jgi:hypothetical protein
MVTDIQKLAFRIRAAWWGGADVCVIGLKPINISPPRAQPSWIGRRLHIHNVTRGEVAREGILSSLYF